MTTELVVLQPGDLAPDQFAIDPATGKIRYTPPQPVPVAPASNAVTYPINNVASFTASHPFPYPPRVTLLDNTETEVCTDVSHSAGQVYLTFPAPFTGTLILS